MFFKLGISLVCLLLSLGNACESKSGISRNHAQGRASQRASAATPDPAALQGEAKSEESLALSAEALNACALIEKSEIASVQGVSVQQAQPTSQKNGDLDISQCYYTATSADGSKNLSVFVQVIQLNPKSTRRDALKEFWEERFGRESKERRREAREDREAGEEEEAINPPQRVSGIGNEAFWLGSNRGGALFVLQKEKVLRVTVGGADAAIVQLERSKTLAKKALARLMYLFRWKPCSRRTFTCRHLKEERYVTGFTKAPHYFYCVELAYESNRHGSRLRHRDCNHYGSDGRVYGKHSRGRHASYE
jgi:hypothetical protein